MIKQRQFHNWDYLINKRKMKLFKDRKSAGNLLSKHLQQFKGQEKTIVLAIPRGGVVVAAEIAKDLKLPLDIIVTRKIGAPGQAELALGAVDPDGQVIWEQQLLSDLGLQIDDLTDQVKQSVEEIKRRENVYRQANLPLKLARKVVILVDDGIATGSTIIAAINYLKRHQVNKIILAVPVASQDTKDKVVRGLGQFGEVIILETPDYFQAVGQFYHQFEPVTDEEVIEVLKK